MAKGIARFEILLLLTLVNGYSQALWAGYLPINEFMINPAKLPDTFGKSSKFKIWIDNDNKPCGYSIDGDGGNSHRFESDLLILPSIFLTLACSVDPGFVLEYVYIDFIHENQNDTIGFHSRLTELLYLDYGNRFASPGLLSELDALPDGGLKYALGLVPLCYKPSSVGSSGDASGSQQTSICKFREVRCS